MEYPVNRRKEDRVFSSFNLPPVLRPRRPGAFFWLIFSVLYRKLNTGMKGTKMAKGPKKHPMSIAKTKFARHRAQAKYRNIPFQFDFLTWYRWWLSHGVDKNQNLQWRTGTRLCMCRYADQGAYHPNNVYVATHVQNAADAHQFTTHPRLKWKNYRVGDQEMTHTEILEYCDSQGLNPHNRYKFLKKTYEEELVKEYTRLARRFRVVFGTLTRRRWWEGKTGCYRTRIAAARDYNMSLDAYLTRERKKTPGFGVYRCGDFAKFYQQNTVYPDGLTRLRELGKELDL